MRFRLSHVAVAFGLFTMAGCEIHEGNLDWDGSFWDEDSSIGAGKRDARASDDDAGPDPRDAGKAPKDAGAANDAGTAKDAGNTDIPLDAGDIGTEPDSTLKPADAPAALAKGLCSAFSSCLGPTLLLELFNQVPCEDFLTRQQADRDLHFLNASIAANRAAFNPNSFATCQADLKKQGCDVQSRRLPASCREAIEGKVDIEGYCNIDYDCAGSAYCDKGLQETCPGTCRELQSSGLPCLASVECADGLICRGSTCRPPLAEGDTCTTRLGRECPVGLACQGKSDSLKCQSIQSVYVGKVNDACDAVGKLCQFGLVCQSQSASNTTGVCVAVADKNGKCKPAVPSQCPADQYCKDSRAQVATRAPAGKEGICSDLPKDKSSCDAAASCAPGSICLNSDKLCHAYKTAGQDCVEAAECYSGTCDQNICVTPIDCGTTGK
jgi:hypothetical protein